MSSTAARHGSGLGSTDDNEVVYCHECTHDWYRSDSGLICPQCGSEATEIVDLEDDPRRADEDEASESSDSDARYPFHDNHDDVPDPDEADIDGLDTGHDHTNSYGRHNYNGHPSVEGVFREFLGMVNGFGPPQNPPTDTSQGRDLPAPFGPFGPDNFDQANVRHETHTIRHPFGNGTASLTIVSGPAVLGGGPFGSPGAPGDPRPDPFQAIFANILRGVGPPQPQNEPGQGFARSLGELFNLLQHGGVGFNGDAVYSQEALDRIISNLMDANTHSNAAPPASEAALNKLDRKTISKEMIEREGKTDCSICLDDLVEGQVGAVLPCKHWFHETCVVEWLKAHNTCPVCRAPIEKENRENRNQDGGHGQSGSNNPDPGEHNHGSGPPGERGSPGTDRHPRDDHPSGAGNRRDFQGRPASQIPFQTALPHISELLGGGTDWRRTHGPDPANPPNGTWTFHYSNVEEPTRNEQDYQFMGSPFMYQPRPRMYSRSHSRMNEAMRNVSYHQQQQRQAAQEGRSPRETPGYMRNSFSRTASHEGSRSHRRSSMSPTSPTYSNTTERSARHRERSPTNNSRRGEGESDRRQSQGSNGPFGWLRDRFSGGRSGGSRDRDDRRN